MGYFALQTNSGNNNIALGYIAMNNNLGSQNIAMGTSSLRNSKGDTNLALGYYALYTNSGSSNIALGGYALQGNSGSYNVAIGENALKANSGLNNIAIGLDALAVNVNVGGNTNIAMGTSALNINIGRDNIAMGFETLMGNSGSYNVALGLSALRSNSGNDNVALGRYSLYSNSGGQNNLAIGSGAMYWNQGGDNNIALGSRAMRSNSQGDFNIVIGADGFYANSGGSYNLMLGYRAGYNINGGSGNVVIGNNAGPAGATAPSNTLWIANASGGTPLLFGNFATGYVGIGTTNPTSRLSIAGTSSMISNTSGDIVFRAASYTVVRSASGTASTLQIDTVDSALSSTLRFSNSSKTLFYMHTNQAADASRLYITDSGNTNGVYLIQGQTDWTANSDSRLKNNVLTIGSALSKVLQMRGVTYSLNTSGTREIGVIAQEVNPLFPELVDDPATGYWGVMYGRIAPILIEAIKEQQFQISGLTDSSVPEALLGVSTLGTQLTSLSSQMVVMDSSYAQLASLSGQVENLELINAGLASMSSQIDSLVISASENTTAVSLLEGKVNLINEILGLNTLQSTESTQSVESTQSTASTGLAGILANITQTIDNFKSFISALGLRADEETQSLIVDSNLNVMGNTTLGNTTITGDLQAGLIKFNTLENSLNVLGVSCYDPETKETDTALCQSQTLFLQKGLAGNLNIFDGKIVLEPNGTLKVQGTVEAEKFSVNTTKQESATAGKAVIPAGSSTFEIKTTAVSGSTLILVTPERPVALGSKVSDTADGFVITLKDAETEDLPVNWLLVDTTNGQ
jgi:hypothetical protein